MRIKAVITILAVGMTVAGCSSFGLDRRTDQEKALPYKARLSEQKDGTLHVSVRAGVAGLNELRESARYQVTRHCLTKRGSSDADWVIDPQTGDWAVQSDGKGTYSLQARCRRG